MRRFLVALALLLVFAGTCITASSEGLLLSDDKRPDGFRDVKWGQDIETVKGLKVLEEHGDGRVKICQIKKDSKRMGSAKLEAIYYCSLENKIESVQIWLKGKKNAEYSLVELVKDFGAPHKDEKKGMMTRKQWLFNDVEITHFYESVSGECTLFYNRYPGAFEIRKILNEII